MIDGFVLATPLLLLLLVGLLTRFIGCASFGTVPSSSTPDPGLAVTITTLSASPNPSALGELVNFAVHVAAAGGAAVVGPVELHDGASLLASGATDATGNATLSYAFLTAGTHNVVAVYPGVPGSFLPSPSAVWPQVVNPGPPPMPITFRQAAENSETLNNSSISTVAFGAAVGAGDLMVVWIFWRSPSATTVAGVVDSAGNTYQRAIGPLSGVGTMAGFQQEIWYAKNIKAGALVQVTATFPLAFNFEKNICALEYAGADKAAPLDKTASATGAGVNANLGPVTTTAPGIVFAAAVFNSKGTSGPGFTQRSSLKNNAAEDESSPAPATVTASFANTAQDWLGQLVTFK